MERRKRKSSMLFILSVLLVTLLGVGVVGMRVQAETITLADKYVLEERGDGYYNLTIKYINECTHTGVESCTCLDDVDCRIGNHLRVDGNNLYKKSEES